MRYRDAVIALSALHFSPSAALRDPAGFETASDLYHFVTRPEIKAPRYMVAKHRPDAISPGHWFVTPYTHLSSLPETLRQDHVPCQTGPAIYDADGELVWSGACQFDNLNSFDFKPVSINGSQHLSFVSSLRRVLLDSHYTELSMYQHAGGDFHEFTILPPDGQQALATWSNLDERDGVLLQRSGFSQISLWDNATTFHWDPLAHGLTLGESFTTQEWWPRPAGWDYFHINSVDQSLVNQDYLVSARYTSTVYRVSSKDGSIVWRLGGKNSDFVMDEEAKFNWQHHARFQAENETHAIISLFDNGALDYTPDDSVYSGRSSVKLLALDLSVSPMRATLLRQLPRPDGHVTDKTGSVDIMKGSNVFTNWATSGYVTEHDANDQLVLEAKFMSPRFNTYRAYKRPFVGTPLERPIVRMIPMQASHTGNDTAFTAFYVSWNGATEVASWRFYASESPTTGFAFLASVPRTGFETSWLYPDSVAYGYAEAMDALGNVLNQSHTASVLEEVEVGFRLPSTSADSTVLLAQSSSDPLGKQSVADHTYQASKDIATLLLAAFGVVAMLRWLARMGLSKWTGSSHRRWSPFATRGKYSSLSDAGDDEAELLSTG